MGADILSRKHISLLFIVVGWMVLFLPFGTLAEMAVLNETEMQTMIGAKGVCLTAVQGDCPSYRKKKQSVISDEEVLKLIEDGSINLISEDGSGFLPAEDMLLNTISSPALIERADVVPATIEIEMPTLEIDPAPREMGTITPELTTIPSQPAGNAGLSGGALLYAH